MEETLPHSVGICSRVLLLFYHDMDSYGGVQSAVIRVALSAERGGAKVNLICRKGLVIPEANQINRVDLEHLFAWLVTQSTMWKNTSVDLLAFAPASGAYAALAADYLATLAQNVRFSLGVFHPRDFNRESEKRHVHLLNRYLIAAIGSSSLHFMNLECRASVSRLLSCDLQSAKIVPVPIDFHPRSWSCVSSDTLRIVSVGRLVEFKSATLHLAVLVQKLVKSGKRIRLDIFGYGPLIHKLNEIIRDVPDVQFKGVLPLDDFPGVVSNYDLFIGMGTSAVQAALIGVPTLMTIDRNPHDSYGFLHELPFGNVGEFIEDRETAPLEDLVLAYYSQNRQERTRLSHLCEEQARKFVRNDYAKSVFVDSTRQNTRLKSISVLYIRFYIWMTEDNLLRRVLRGTKRTLQRLNILPKVDD